MSAEARVRVGVDIGGTFTDVALERGAERVTVKVLTTSRAPADGVLTALETAVTRAGVEPGEVGIIVHGTTLATNAIIERKGAVTALITTEGFRDVLELGTESRFEQYDLNIAKPPPLVPRRLRFTVPERVGAEGQVLVELDERAVADLVPALSAAGVESIAIAFLHSYARPDHERRAAALLRRLLPDLRISLSAEVSPEIREYERFSTTCANAYVQPLVAGYLERLRERLAEAGFACPLFLMLSSGGITEIDTAIRFPVRLVESGPAGGAVLACDLARRCGLDRVISFDMGGTTAKICLIDQAAPQMARAFEVARAYRFKPGSGLPLRIPVIEMVEIGAGGGSVARVDAMKRIAVGPESAGAEPGPACYGRGGEAATVTDADLCLGAISADHFAGGTMKLDGARAEAALNRHIAVPLGHDPLFAAFGVAEIVDENMANAAREHAVERGKSLGERTMIAFGGCAPLHAARLAEKLDIGCIVVPRSAGVGSAVGFLRAPVAYEVARTSYQRLSALDGARLNEMFAEMGAEAHAVVERAAPGAPRTEARLAHMRYVGQGHEIAVAVQARPFEPGDGATLRQAYDDAYRRKYGRLIEGVDVEVMGWSLSVTAANDEPAPEPSVAPLAPPPPAGRRRLFEPISGERRDVPLYHRADLAPGTVIAGPAVIVEDETSTVVSAAFTARVSAEGHLFLERQRG